MEDKNINHCVWCGCPTLMEKMQLPATPILEFLENKIDLIGRNKVWGTYSDWSKLNLDSDVEAELLVYDEMLSNISLKTVCEKCLSEDERLYKKYYGDDQEIDLMFDSEF